MNRERVGDVLQLQRRAVAIDPTALYVSIGVRSFGKGIFHYPPTPGSELSKLRFFEIHPGELVVSNIKAWEGAIAVSSPSDAACIGSNRFLTYEPIDGAIDVRYACYFFLSEAGLPLIQRASPGSADRNRTLAIDRFENLVVPLPDGAEQRRVARAIEGRLTRVRTVADAYEPVAPSRLSRLIPALLDATLAKYAAGQGPVGEAVELVSDVVHPGDDPTPAEAFVGLQHVESHTGRRVGDLLLGAEKGRKFRFRPGDVVYGYLRPYLNKVWVADRHGLCSVDQYVLRVRDSYPPVLLAYALRSRSFLDEAIRLTHNLQLPRLRSGLLANIQIPVIDARRRESAQAALSRIDESIQSVMDLRRFQQARVQALGASVLNHAFAGPL